MAVAIITVLSAGVFLFAVSGLLPVRHGRFVAVAAGLLVATAAIGSLVNADTARLDLEWAVPFGRFSIAVDALSAAFLLPVALIPALGAVYASAYVSPDRLNARRMRVGYGILPAAMALVVVAQNGLLLLVAWEVMALTAYFLLTADENDPAVRHSGWVYLVATHVGTLCLVAGFALVFNATGTMQLSSLSSLPASTQATVAVLFLVGFGMKAGLMPLHVWLPGAHANAPSHVSAVMSGVVLKMGVYGIARMIGLLGELPEQAGQALLALGALSAVFGAAFACAQSDLKRLLAYSSVDNMGIVAMGLGLALIGRAAGRGDLVVLGTAGAMLHVWNHALFKPLLFFAAGAVVHATGTRQLDRLGGLAATMPRTATVTATGAIALAGLPPLNGFVSELIIYLGLFRAMGELSFPAIAAPALATTGALVALAMIKLYGVAFLGVPRTETAQHAHDPARSMLIPMQLLAASCATLAFASVALLPVLDRVAATFAAETPPLATLISFGPVLLTTAAIAVMVAVLALLARRLGAGSAASQTGTWGCGFPAPTARMQYTGSSLTQTAVSWLALVLRPARRRPTIVGVWPGASQVTEDVRDPVLDQVALPAFQLARRSLPWLRHLQQGNLHLYILYVLLALVALLLWQ